MFYLTRSTVRISSHFEQLGYQSLTLARGVSGLVRLHALCSALFHVLLGLQVPILVLVLLGFPAVAAQLDLLDNLLSDKAAAPCELKPCAPVWLFARASYRFHATALRS